MRAGTVELIAAADRGLALLALRLLSVIVGRKKTRTMSRRKNIRGTSGRVALSVQTFATRLPLLLDTPGLFYVEARTRIARGTKGLAKLLPELKKHRSRVVAAIATNGSDVEDAWIDVIQGVGSLETTFGATIREFGVADVLLVAAAESYINAIAAHILNGADAEHFDKLSPVGKWLFLPQLMKLKWKPTLASGCLQQFAAVVARRNRIVHPRPLKVDGTVDVDAFIKQLKLDATSANAGVEAVKDLIRGISLAWRGGYGPDWLDPGKAANRPPCFILGTVEASGRLGRGRLKRPSAAAQQVVPTDASALRRPRR